MSEKDLASKTSCATQTSQLPLSFWLLLALTALVRMPGITRPLLGNFATKNVVYAMIARNWAHARADLWHPTVDVLCGDGRGWHLVEFPVSAYLTGGLWRLLGGSLDVWGRATAVTFSVGSVALIYLFVRRRHGAVAATAAALALALAPVSVIYGQSFMLEASLVFFTVATFYALDRWLDAGRLAWLVIATACLALLLLTKIYMLVLLLPLGWLALRRHFPWGRFPNLPEQSCQLQQRQVGKPAPRAAIWIAAALALIPAALWYIHAYRTAAPDGPFAERVFFSVRRSATDHLPPHPLLFSGDFYRQLLDDLTGVALTPVGFTLALAGLLSRRWRQYLPWLAAMLLLVVALPRKFYEMNYYAMVVLPPLCILIGLGWQTIAERVRPGRLATAVLMMVVLVLSARYSRPAFVTPAEDRGVVEAARAVRELTAENEPVVTMHGTSIDLLYYCNRPGWAVDPHGPELAALLEQYRARGARYLVVVGRETPNLGDLVRRGEDYCVYRLSPDVNH